MNTDGFPMTMIQKVRLYFLVKLAAQDFMTLQRVKLIQFFKSNPALWDNSSWKVRKMAKGTATSTLVEAFDDQ